MKEQQPTVITIRKKITRDNRSLSSMYVPGEIITTASPDWERIPRKKRKNKLSEISITGNKITQEQDNQSKKKSWVVALMEKKSM